MPLAKAAAAYGIDGIFTEVYPDPDSAQCDGPNSLALDAVTPMLELVQSIRHIAESESAQGQSIDTEAPICSGTQ